MEKLKILIVDDDENMTKLLEMILKDKNYDVFISNDIINASRKIQNSNYDLILLDIMLSWMSGYDFYELLRNIPETEETPVIFISGKSSEKDIKKGLNCGAQGYITKPFHKDVLLNEIEKVINH